jgi:hypothetical protein
MVLLFLMANLAAALLQNCRTKSEICMKQNPKKDELIEITKSASD